MKIPNTYSEWLDCFDAAKTCTCDAEVLSCVKKGSLTLSAGVGPRFAEQLSNVIEFRIKRASDKFSRTIDTSCGNEVIIINALILFRKEFNFLIQFVENPVLSSRDIDMITTSIKKHADSIQESLESKIIKQDKTGMLLSIIRKNNINRWEK